jgi:D-lactate dehydrogenase
MDVFFYEVFEEEEQALKGYLPANIEAGFTWKTIQESGNIEPAAKVISIRTQSIIPVEWSGKLSAILSRSSGYNHLSEYKKASGAKIECGYLPLYCNRAVAEQAMLMWMALLRKLPQQMQNFAAFNRDGITGNDCKEKILLVVGVGNIGSEIVKIGQGLGMKVLGVDIIKKYSFVDYVSIEDGLSKADVIVCAMNLTSENINYFNYERLRTAKRGAVFVNIARGEFAPSMDIVRLLDQGCLGGAGLDVYKNQYTKRHNRA